MLYLKLEELIEKLTRHVCKDASREKFNQLFEAQNILPMREIVVPKAVKEKLEKTFLKKLFYCLCKMPETIVY